MCFISIIMVASVASFPGSPTWRRWKVRRGRAWYPFVCDVRHVCRGYNELICYITTTACQLLWQQKMDREKILLMATPEKEVTWWYRLLGIPVVFSIITVCNLFSPLDKTDVSAGESCLKERLVTHLSVAWWVGLVPVRRCKNWSNFRLSLVLIFSVNWDEDLSFTCCKASACSGRRANSSCLFWKNRSV